MKMGLIKKSFICALSISCFAMISACSNSTTKVFANKDIQAYAKKNDIENQVSGFEYKEIKDSEKTIVTNSFSFSLLKDKTTLKYQLYMRYPNIIFDIPTDEDESVDNVKENNDLENSYGYYVISFSTGKKMAIDYKGDVVISKMEADSMEINPNTNRLINYEPLYTGEKTFYDFAFITKDDVTTEEVYEVRATFKNGTITDFERKKITKDEIDYSIINNKTNATAINLKKYSIYSDSGSIYVKDINNKLVSSFYMGSLSYTYFAMDDRLFYQTSKTVTINDDYTYMHEDEFYQVKTYSVNLLNGKTEEIKNYDYYLNNYKYVYGYNENTNRTYIAGVYARLGKIVNKKLELKYTTAMIDKCGKILSDKIGEKGVTLKYFDDETYVLYDEKFMSVINKNGKVKATYLTEDETLSIDYYNKYMFIQLDNGGYFVDNNLKLTSDNISFPYEIEHTFNNGYMVLSQYSTTRFVGKIEDGNVVVIDKVDRVLDRALPTLDNERTLVISDTLNFSNVYLIITKVANKYNVEIYSVDGALLKAIDGATDVELLYNQFILGIETLDETYYYAFKYINMKRSSSNNYN